MLLSKVNDILIVLASNNNSLDNIKELINKILNIIMPLLMIIATATAIVMTAIVFISGMKDIDGIERKQKIWRLIWIWTCCGGVFLSATIVLCLTNIFNEFSFIINF